MDTFINFFSYIGILLICTGIQIVLKGKPSILFQMLSMLCIPIVPLILYFFDCPYELVFISFLYMVICEFGIPSGNPGIIYDIQKNYGRNIAGACYALILVTIAYSAYKYLF